MAHPTAETESIMIQRFGQDSLIALATAEGGIPHVRTVNAFYENGSFYILTHAKSGKMRQIRQNAIVAVSGDWFTAHGTGENLGWFGAAHNARIAESMRKVFSAWIDNGHNDFSDPDTCILRIRLTDAVLLSNGNRYAIEYC